MTEYLETDEEVHEDPSSHRSVHVLIFDDDGKVVSQLRDKSKERRPLHWTSSAAGHVKQGEEPLDAAERELEEEIDVDTELNFAGKFKNEDGVDDEFIYVFYGEHPGPYRLREEAEEISEFDVEYLLENPDDLKIDPNFEKVLEFFVENAEHEASDR